MRKLVFTLAIAVGLIAACGSSTGHTAATTTSVAASFPRTVDGVTIDHRPTHIVSLSATATEMLYAIGAGNQITAVDTYSTYPPSAPRTKLNGYDLDAETLVPYHPDLVVIADDTAGKITGALKALDIPVLLLPAASHLEDSYRQFRELGKATGNDHGAATAVAHLRHSLDVTARRIGPIAKGKTYYHELDNTLYSATSDTFIGEIYTRLGMINIADASGAPGNNGYPQLSAEYVVKANPDYVFLADSECCQQTAASFAARPGFGDLKAVREHHVFAINDDLASHWGPRLVDFLTEVARDIRGTTASANSDAPTGSSRSAANP